MLDIWYPCGDDRLAWLGELVARGVTVKPILRSTLKLRRGAGLEDVFVRVKLKEILIRYSFASIPVSFSTYPTHGSSDRISIIIYCEPLFAASLFFA